MSLLPPESFHLEDQRVQSHSVDLRDRVRSEGVIVGLRVEAVTDARTRPSGSAFPLLRAGSADPELLQALHLGLRIETHFLHLSCKTKTTLRTLQLITHSRISVRQLCKQENLPEKRAEPSV